MSLCIMQEGEKPQDVDDLIFRDEPPQPVSQR